MTEPVWTALPFAPPGSPIPKLPPGYESEPVLWPDGALRGYLCRWTFPDGEAGSGTLAWAQNGSPDTCAWRWLPLVEARGPAPEPHTVPAKRPRKPKAAPEPADTPGEPEPPQEPPALDDMPPFPFTLLGHDHGTYFYMGHGTRQLTALRASQHTPLNLGMLAPASFWARRWSAKRGFDSEQAGMDLMNMQHRAGIYDPSRIRGRGAWWDQETGEALVHLGDRLILGGREMDLHDHGSKWIYESAVPLPISEPLRNSEAVKLAEICEQISWENPISARLLAGFIPCALICGALRWKPNVLLLGEKESGKSTIIEQIVKAALGKNVLYCLGGTSEASVRAILRADAIPIIIDDLDSDTARGKENVKAVLELMKIFSGEGGGAMHKASQSGGAPVSYKIHSCYIYSGTRMIAEDGAVVSRIAILKIKRRKFEHSQYLDFLSMIQETLTPAFAQALFGRCIKLIPVIRQNAEIFAQAIAAKTGSRRSGDVNGHLFAGAYSLHSENVITQEAAAEYVGTRAEVMALVLEEKQAVAENRDADKCLSHLLEQVLTDTYDGRTMRASVFELLKRSSLGFGDSEQALQLLRRTGIIVKDGFFYVANDHSLLREVFSKSQWPHGWAAILKSCEGAEVTSPRYFGARSTRSVRLPLPVQAAPPPEPPPDDVLI